MPITLSSEKFKELMKQYTADYTLGIHNFQDGIYTKPEYRHNQENGIKNRIESILQNGLEFSRDKALLSCIYFNPNLEMYLNNLGGIIIAVPKILKYGEESIFIGSPTEENEHYSFGRDIKVEEGGKRCPRFDRNHSFTSLCDIALPDETEQRQALSPIFILATYTQVAENEFAFSFNSKHIVYNEGCVPEKYFNNKKQIINKIYEEYGVKKPIIGLDQDLLHLQAAYGTICAQESEYGGYREALLETIEQFQAEVREKNSLKNRIKFDAPVIKPVPRKEGSAPKSGPIQE